MASVFDSVAGPYDAWYDEPEGAAIFAAERDCLLRLHSGPFDRWVEVGVGTGRFSQALGIRAGIDPSTSMSAIAARRGIETVRGHAEHLPYADGALDGILMALTLCFVGDAAQALRECKRVLHPEGRLLLGAVPADSQWGLSYQAAAAQGHPIYSHAHFRTTDETLALAKAAGLELIDAASSLFWSPTDEPGLSPKVESGIASRAGFVALLLATPQ